MNVLVTGASGYVGTQCVRALHAARSTHAIDTIIATDIRARAQPPGVVFVPHDVRSDGLEALCRTHAIDVVVHLASIVTPGAESTRALEYEVDVVGTERVLAACIAAGVRRIVVTSSGAAYGYHPDLPAWIDESVPIRGNEAFAYSWHKALVEARLAAARTTHPALEQVVLRVGTIIGPTVDNQITALFERPRLLCIAGAASPFTFIDEDDLAAILVRAVTGPVTGIFNVAGDSALAMREIAALLGKPTLTLPAWLLRAVLAVARPLGLTRYGPEQVDFLRYRPVLANRALKERFGYTPRRTSRDAFLRWRETRRGSPLGE
ncbi:MAG: SDR family oxidoreductase [Gemmatimonadaceae bacterium]|nr:SDR family oxidoreductase [Gemmatimonadaceae bacterium]